MLSEKQLLANRQNAIKSTGPRTPAGKAIASYSHFTKRTHLKGKAWSGLVLRGFSEAKGGTIVKI